MSPGGELVTRKLLSERAGSRRDSTLTAIRNIMGICGNTPVGAGQISELRMGTTVATNALLERQGAPAALLITRGFKDALRIAYQNRPLLFARQICLREPLYARVIEASERVGAGGEVIVPLDESALEHDLSTLLADGIESIGIVFMHAYRFPEHEQSAARIARRLGFSNVSVSHDLNPLIKLVARGDTTMVDAYLNPILREYVDETTSRLRQITPVDRLLFMQSSGGLTDAGAFRGKDSILSGPAGGIVGMARSAAAEGISQVIGFDMGGTSTDVSIFSGSYERSEETEVAGARIRAAMLKIHTVAAGGGSILHFSEGRLQVGPRSAGARPGPAAYGLGGPLTVTDCNVLLGRLQPDFFPAVLGTDGHSQLQVELVKQKFAALANELQDAGFATTPIQLARLFQDIAVQRMAGAIKHISLSGGHDLGDFVLACFGGAGPQHACQVAEELGISKVLIHPLAGLLSAWGIGLAPVTSLRQRTLRRDLDKSGMALLSRTEELLRQEVIDDLAAQGIDEHANTKVSVTVLLRYAGTDTSLAIERADAQRMRDRFTSAHLARFGFAAPDKKLVIESVLVLAQIETPIAEFQDTGLHDPSPRDPVAIATRSVFFAGQHCATPFYERNSLAPGMTVSGPGVVLQEGATTIIEPGWQARVTPRNQLLLSRTGHKASFRPGDTQADPARLEVFNNLFMHIAEQMGLVLQNTARSVNIKERLDFSCAVFDGAGALVANAPHMPVHLGSMGESVSAVIRDNPDLEDGDVYMLNDPYRGGTHLPDITVVAPVFVPGREAPDFYVAARGHHADIGGVTPGSMPPDSENIAQEGILFSNFRLVHRGHFDEAALQAALTSPPYPARDPGQNIADLKAQVAACRQGIRLLMASVGKYGDEVLRAYLQHVQDNAEQAVRDALSNLADGEFEYPMDNGLVIRVAVRVDRKARTASVDFAGTSRQHKGNFNAPYAVCRAAVLYVFRCLVDAPIPLNAGCLKPIRIKVPEGSILNPRPPAAVAAGNVETSQAITNALFGALGIMAAAQGTMNNLTFGDARRQYYETIAGGAGAGPDHDGADAVQTHMTNSRLTDPEILELRYPVRVHEFSLRHGSGGAGRHRGGNGAYREIEFLAPMQAAILSGHRTIPPFGLAGGRPGQCGRNTLVRAGEPAVSLGATASTNVAAGDRIIIETPGGGGYGEPESEK